MYKIHFFCTLAKLFSAGRGSFLALSAARGTQGGRVYTTTQVWPPAEPRVAHSGRPKSRELDLFQRIAFRDAEPRRTMETPKSLLFALLLLYHTRITPSPKLSSSLICGSHATTAVEHQALFPFVTASNGTSGCAMFPVDLGNI